MYACCLFVTIISNGFDKDECSEFHHDVPKCQDRLGYSHGRTVSIKVMLSTVDSYLSFSWVFVTFYLTVDSITFVLSVRPALYYQLIPMRSPGIRDPVT